MGPKPRIVLSRASGNLLDWTGKECLKTDQCESEVAVRQPAHGGGVDAEVEESTVLGAIARQRLVKTEKT
jgi:hypothetical protein